MDLSRGIVAFRKRGDKIEYLLLLKKTGDDWYWSFPKGHPEPSETPLENALREFSEETGLSSNVLTILDHLGPFSETYKNSKGCKICYYFVGEMPLDESMSIAVQASDVSGWAWSTLERALQRLTFDTTKVMLSEISESLGVRK